MTRAWGKPDGLGSGSVANAGELHPRQRAIRSDSEKWLPAKLEQLIKEFIDQHEWMSYDADLKRYSYDELIARDKVSLDLIWPEFDGLGWLWGGL